MKPQILHFIGSLNLFLCLYLCFVPSADTQAQKQPSTQFVDVEFEFDSTVTTLIYGKKYYFAAQYFIAKDDIQAEVKAQIQCKTISVFGTIVEMRGKTMVNSQGHKIAAKDVYKVIAGAKIKIATEKSQ